MKEIVIVKKNVCFEQFGILPSNTYLGDKKMNTIITYVNKQLIDNNYKQIISVTIEDNIYSYTLYTYIFFF